MLVWICSLLSRGTFEKSELMTILYSVITAVQEEEEVRVQGHWYTGYIKLRGFCHVLAN